MKSIGLIVVFIAVSFQSPTKRAKHFNLEDGLALEGYDLVEYFNMKPTKGKEGFTYTYQSVSYRFSSKKNLELFKASPAKYEPQYGGWCAYAMGNSGEKVSVDPETFKIINGKLYLFYNSWGNNTLLKWNKNEANLKKAADTNWLKILSK